MQLGRIVADHPQVIELDINPLLCDPSGVIAVDGRVRVRAATAASADRMAIRPYPDRFESELNVGGDGVFRVRPIRPEDEPALTRLRPRGRRSRSLASVFRGVARPHP